jgi:thiamine pyrophosphate-dependent acetolactate synthase large subunit-like protein
MAEAFGGRGWFVTKAEELEPVLKEALADSRANIVNIMISARSQRKPQQFAWLTR